MIVEKPKFWTWATLNINKENMEQVVSSRRLRIVTKAALECVGDTSPTCKDSILRFYTHILHLLRCDNQPMELKSLKISADLEEEDFSSFEDLFDLEGAPLEEDEEGSLLALAGSFFTWNWDDGSVYK